MSRWHRMTKCRAGNRRTNRLRTRRAGRRANSSWSQCALYHDADSFKRVRSIRQSRRHKQQCASTHAPYVVLWSACLDFRPIGGRVVKHSPNMRAISTTASFFLHDFFAHTPPSRAPSPSHIHSHLWLWCITCRRLNSVAIKLLLCSRNLGFLRLPCEEKNSCVKLKRHRLPGRIGCDVRLGVAQRSF